MLFIKITICLIVSLFFSTVNASGAFPRGCEVTGYGFANDHLILNDSGQQSLYLIENRSNYTIDLERIEAPDVFMSPKLESKLSADQWAAFASDEQNLHFQCATRNGETKQIVACSEVLQVCQYPRVKFVLSNMGNYWISTNKPQAQVIKDTVAKGIYLRW